MKAATVTVSQGPFLLDEVPRKERKRGNFPKPQMRHQQIQPSFDESEKERGKSLKHVAAAMAIVGVLYFGYKSRQLGPVGYDNVSTKSDRLQLLHVPPMQ
ncbi:hypothetical protein QZH41_000364 [Actinostola sp. cb2023]|nr:hypothetical protein QZH41_000364 [Actinostola sp. cb2023]